MNDSLILVGVLLLSGLMIAAPRSAHSQAPPAPGAWAYYKQHFISQEGRVIDIYQSQISHSEGQGYGMLLALFHDDRDAFVSMLKWTRDNLMVRPDGLAAWSWGQRATGDWQILDYNNATDGDLLLAWALLRGHDQWPGQEDWEQQAAAILATVRRNLVLQRGERTLLLPGYYGFSNPEGLRLNPSYFLFPGFQRFADLPDQTAVNASAKASVKGSANASANAAGKTSEAAPKAAHEPQSPPNRQFWQSIYADSMAIVVQSLRSRLNLPPDWVLLASEDQLIPDPSAADFGYEAIRVPLYLALARDTKALAFMTTYLQFIDRIGYVPQTVNLAREQIAVQEASAGFHAVLAACAELLGHGQLAQTLWQSAERNIRQEPDDYYSHTLYLLAATLRQR